MAASSAAAEVHRQHGAGRQPLHQPAARGHQGERVLERQHAGQVGGHVLADAVAEHRLRHDAPVLPQLASAYSITNSAGCASRVSSSAASPPAANKRVRMSRPRCGRRIARSGRSLAEDRLGLVQPAAHAGVLAALAAEQERDRPRAAVVVTAGDRSALGSRNAAQLVRAVCATRTRRWTDADRPCSV